MRFSLPWNKIKLWDISLLHKIGSLYTYFIPYVLPSGLRSLMWSCHHIPVDERVSHSSCDGAGLRFTQSEDALDDGQLSARGVQSTESTPVVHHHTSSDHLTTTIDRSSLERTRLSVSQQNSCIQPWGFPPKYNSYFSLGFDDIVNTCVPSSLQKVISNTFIDKYWYTKAKNRK